MELLQQLEAQLQGISAEVETLRNSETVTKYFDCVTQQYQLIEQIQQLRREQQMQKYATCNHLWVIDYILQYPHYDTPINYHGCIKCGLDQSVLLYQEEDLSLLTQEAVAMYEFFKKSGITGEFDRLSQSLNLSSSMHTFETCDIDLGCAIYSKIKMAHPNIDDLTALHYFKKALKNIKMSPENQAKERKRKQRLSLEEEAQLTISKPLKRKVYTMPGITQK